MAARFFVSGYNHRVPATALGRRPVPLVLAGALAISFSAILYRYSEVSPSTGATALVRVARA